ncbi:MAG TPA: wax ester/triacylglycerol synthase domain-containing protein [Mycobacterium sp.]|nr:wax ester/triacylglycerol synthase domain-containing protein [Mycobacterium sp.]
MSRTDGTYMRASDAFAWYMERDPALRSTVVGVFWLDRAPDWDRFVDRIDRMSRTMLSLRQRVVESPWRLATPRLIYDDHFDLKWHLRRVNAPEPRTRDAVLELARLAAMDTFDRERPLWEFTLVEGMKGNEAAVVVKIHHSLSDGVGWMQMKGVLFDMERQPGDLGPMPPAPPGETFSRQALITAAVGSMFGRVAHRGRLGVEAAIPTLARTARDPIGTVRGAAAMARSAYRFAAPVSDTMSPVMRERAMVRRLATMEIPLNDLKRAAESVDATVNDAYLAAVTGGLRRYHLRHDSTVESLRVTIPINIRTKADDWTFGNRITLRRVTVPVGESNPANRMRMVHRVAESARDEPSNPITDTIAEGLNLLPVGYVGGMLKHVDFVASNVPGSPVPIYLAGGEVTGFFAFGPTIGASFNITLISHAGSCDIGINIDTCAVPDSDVLLDCLREGFDEISAVGIDDKLNGDHPRTTRPRARPKPST